MIFVDISLLFYWGDLRLLSLGNSLEPCCHGDHLTVSFSCWL